MFTSIIIPTYNKLPRLRLMMCSLREQLQMDNCEVLFVDDGSEDGTNEFLHEQESSNPLITVIEQTNKGRSCARNNGLQHAKGERVIFIDDDVILSKDFVHTHTKDNNCVRHGKIITLSYLKFFEDPSQGIRFSDSNMKAEHSNSMLKEKCITEKDITENFASTVAVNRKITKLEWLIQQVFESGLRSMLWTGFTGGNVSAPRKWLLDAGGFDEQFSKEWGYEDFELGYRLCRLGYDFEYCDYAVNYHIAHYRDPSKISGITSEYFIKKYDDSGIRSFIDFLDGKMSKNEILDKIKSEEKKGVKHFEQTTGYKNN